MSDLIAIPPAPATPAGTTVSGGAFWPVADVAHFRDIVRIGGPIIPDARLITALAGAYVTVKQELRQLAHKAVASGIARLQDMPDTPLTDSADRPVIFLRALYATAAADLIEGQRDITATSQGLGRIEEQMPTADDYRRNATWAVRDLLEVPRNTVALI
ncbi:MAG: head completion/stabilization protein [Asticcacaulis sp.]